MNEEKLLKKIVIDSKIMAGKPIIKRMRLTVDYILNLLARGMTENQIIAEYNRLTHEDIQACLLFAARSMRGKEACWN